MLQMKCKYITISYPRYNIKKHTQTCEKYADRKAKEKTNKTNEQTTYINPSIYDRI